MLVDIVNKLETYVKLNKFGVLNENRAVFRFGIFI